MNDPELKLFMGPDSMEPYLGLRKTENGVVRELRLYNEPRPPEWYRDGVFERVATDDEANEGKRAFWNQL